MRKPAPSEKLFWAVGEGVVYRGTRDEYFGRRHIALETSILDGRRRVAVASTEGDAVAKHSFGTEADGVDTTKVRLQASVVFFEAISLPSYSS